MDACALSNGQVITPHRNIYVGGCTSNGIGGILLHRHWSGLGGGN